jgi:hypothetical protein
LGAPAFSLRVSCPRADTGRPTFPSLPRQTATGVSARRGQRSQSKPLGRQPRTAQLTGCHTCRAGFRDAQPNTGATVNMNPPSRRQRGCRPLQAQGLRGGAEPPTPATCEPRTWTTGQSVRGREANRARACPIEQAGERLVLLLRSRARAPLSELSGPRKRNPDASPLLTGCPWRPPRRPTQNTAML